MASNHTQNYGLCQWEASDKVLRTDFNADNAKIDAAIGAALSTAAQKADQSALDAEISARTSAVSKLNSAVSRLGNCRIQYFTYTGTGTCGTDAPTRITFSARPVFLVVFGTGEMIFMAKNSTYPLFLGRYNGVNNELTLTTTRSYWEGNSLMLHSYEPVVQMNREGVQYDVVAFYSQDGT